MSDEDLITQALAQMGDAPPADVATETDTATDTIGDTGEADGGTEESGGEAKTEEPKDKEGDKTEDKGGDKPEPKLSKALARVARREASVLELETQVRQREESLAAREQQVDAASRRWAELTEMGRRDPVGFLREAGVDIDALSRQLVSGEAPKQADPTISAMQKELAEIKAALTDRTKQDDQYREQARAAAIERHKRDLHDYVASKPDGIPFVTVLPPDRAVAALEAVIREHWSQTKIVLDRTEAARILNGKLEEHHKLLGQAATKQPAAAPREQQGTGSPATIAKTHRSRTAKNPGRDKMTNEELVQAALEEWKD